MSGITYENEKTREISFPLGGIGTGCIGLSGRGSLIDWEIFNRPNKGKGNGFSHFAIKAEAGGKVLDARVLNGNLQPPYTGSFGTSSFNSFGFGPDRTTMAGVPHFRRVVFTGTYPVASLRFEDPQFPGDVTMEAFNPLIPLNDRDSSIPAAFFEIEVRNPTSEDIDYTVCLSLGNPGKRESSVIRFDRSAQARLLQIASTHMQGDEPEYGDLTAATDVEDVSCQEYWFRGSWFDSLEMFFREFTSPGGLKNRTYRDDATEAKQYPGTGDTGSLSARRTVPAGRTARFRFVIAWNYPNCINYWNPEKPCCTDGSCQPAKPKTWKNYYATIFRDSRHSALYSLEQWDRLEGETKQFRDALFSSTLPPAALDAISANISILKTPTCLRLEDGSFYGWEGCHPDSGCCEGSCTHVWNYAYALPFLFPKLERSMRELDYRYNRREDGGMAFRLQLPLERERSKFRPCADGQFGGVLKTYREWKISGDTEWLRFLWPAVRQSIEFAWSPTNADRWDADRDGVLEGRQHHTLDMELFGPNSWLTGFYLAALKAGAEMADFLGEPDTAAGYRTLFEKGKKWVDEYLFNGDYYQQAIDLKDRSLLESFPDATAISDYWNEESGEIKYQIGEGCAIDQVLAQWHADLIGLGEIFNPEQTRKALAAIFRHNFKERVGDFFNPCRLYSLNDEAGIVICDWPEGKYKPVVPIPYAEETMNGFEYQAAVHMILRGMPAEGMRIVEAVRDRYDGEKRNPWNEFECGSNYARSMASYALLNAFSGFEFDLVQGMVGFHPLGPDRSEFRCFWSLDSGWGIFEADESRLSLTVLYGSLRLDRFHSDRLRGRQLKACRRGGRTLEPKGEPGRLYFPEAVSIREGEALVMLLA